MRPTFSRTQRTRGARWAFAAPPHLCRAAAAFSLIEIMISVLILALGLLGLGAIFPVVIRQQRLGSEATMGALASGSTRAVIANLEQFDKTVWARWRDNNPNGLGPANARFLGHGNQGINAWLVPEIAATGAGAGEVMIDPRHPSNNNPLYLSVRDRLFPRGANGTDPQFVWDYAIQRVRDSDANDANDALRVALFLRRIDQRIRVPRGYTLEDVVTGGNNVPNADRRVAVGVGAAARPLPTGDGSGEYSAPQTFSVLFHYTPGDPEHRFRDRLFATIAIPNDANDPDRIKWRLLSQIGQKLVDNLGNVYTVVSSGVDDDNENYVRVTPAIPSTIMEPQSGPNGLIREVVFTPQVPASVLIWTVKP